MQARGSHHPLLPDMASVIDPRLCVTCSAPNNIAAIKYWGKDSVALNTPTNSSASVTLCQVRTFPVLCYY